MSEQATSTAFPKSKTLDNKYMLGDEIGKGAYGRVDKGLDLENGDFVAIKQVSLENITQEDLNIIMVESRYMEEYNKSSMKRARLNLLLTTLLNDPILSDVPKNPTVVDVDTLISFELGSAMHISVLKLDGTSFDVTVMNSATVKHLKLAIKKKVNDMEQSSMGHRHISWKHIWANYCLSYHNNKLLNDDEPLQSFGIRNNSQVHFVPYVTTKESRRHSKRRKHRFFHGLNKLS